MSESVVYELSCPDYSSELADILEKLDLLSQQNAELLTVMGTIEGFLVFAVVVVLCIFVYKFFRMFF